MGVQTTNDATRPGSTSAGAGRATDSFPHDEPADRFMNANGPEEWIRRVAETRDKHAFELLFLHFAPRLKSHMLRQGLTDTQAEDLAQETLAEVWRKSASYRSETAALSTWIYAIARNLRIDQLRKWRHIEIPLGTESDAATAHEASYANDLDAASLLARMRKLPAEQLRVIELTFIEGKSQSEISALLAVPLGTVKSRLRLAFARIRQELREA
ncbi:MAG TPA: sigma-70 family RNA polymerase sigma factor [Chromatiaceae bacterium]|nr:sigma-70 family RNA polymerase sigma factor [Chromatiaceae bacterium]